MHIVVVGAGYVGLVAACCLSNSGHDVICVESDPEKYGLLCHGESPLREGGIEWPLKQSLSSDRLCFAPSLPVPLKADIVMVAVGTPSQTSGASDLTFVYRVSHQIREVADEPVIVAMKSSVVPGTGNRLMQQFFRDSPVRYVSNPEFLREGQAIEDWYHPSRIVIGTTDRGAGDLVEELYRDIDAPVLRTDVTSAEAIKYGSNAFLVTKISFINEMANFCEVVGACVDDVAEGIGMDPRIGLDFLRAGLGYSGSCFPKDARALDFTGLYRGYDFRLLKATIEVNAKQRVVAVHKLKRLLNGVPDAEVAVLGLTFKPGTDDMRESPAVEVVHLMHEEGFRLRVYDPVAMQSARRVLPVDVACAGDLYEAVCGAQAVLLATEWSEFVMADWAQVRTLMEAPYVVVDGRNALDGSSLAELGFRYEGMGRSSASMARVGR